MDISGRKNNAECAYGAALLTDTAKEMQQMTHTVDRSIGLVICTPKTKAITSPLDSNCQLLVNDETVEKLESFTYLG